MILRDGDGKLWIINRKDCKNDASYYEKIYAISSTFKKGPRGHKPGRAALAGLCGAKPSTFEKGTSSEGFGTQDPAGAAFERSSLRSSNHFPEDIDSEDEDE